jgi:hypothetical protein
MHNKTERKNPKSVETHFCQYFDTYEPIEMSKDQTYIFITCSVTEDKDLSDFEKALSNIYYFYPAIEKRIEFYYNFTMDTRARMVLASWCNNFGDIAMYLAYIQYKCKQTGLRNLGIKELAILFPLGIPSTDFLKKAWSLQKVETVEALDTDNLLDIKNAQKSILFNEENEA